MHPFYNRSRNQQAVPREVAEKLAKQRDRLEAELQKVRRERDQLADQCESKDAEIESLAERLDEAEAEARDLRDEMADIDAAGGIDDEEHEEIVRRLSARIEELRGDLERLQTRSSEHIDDARRAERVRLLKGLGDVLDSTERALDMDTSSGPWRQGLEAIHRQLLAFFKSEGATLIGEVGDSMNPQLHEAIDVVQCPGVASGHVAEVDRRGIELEDGSIVRPAQVRVAA